MSFSSFLSFFQVFTVQSSKKHCSAVTLTNTGNVIYSLN